MSKEATSMYTKWQAFVGTQNRRHSPSISLASLGDLLRTDGAGGSSDCLALTIPRYEMCAPAQLELPSMSPPTDLRRTDDDKKHACPWCGKRFDRPSSLSIHINTHTGDKPFMCAYPGCGRRFNVNSNMRRHYRNHSSPVARQSGTPALSDTLPTPPWDPVYFPKFAAPASRVPSHRPTPIPDAHDYEFEEDSHSDDDPGYRREEAL
ncbi:hypothetical protein CERSUDRAFT_111723 [Gelatoporia subvermispora B]|uniref:C2H2-type domain-containing protein n=1 Tax=Ceriporiopsis subvermispora (strain B) TaxID=914234 RepID=M2QVM9_CERS8|nr:hypothetical protein CERSUDRAFT_111723 [Gelatoporia subvermispora B]